MVRRRRRSLKMKLAGRQPARLRWRRGAQIPPSSSLICTPCCSQRTRSGEVRASKPTPWRAFSYMCKRRLVTHKQPIQTQRRKAPWSRSSITILAAHRAPPSRGIASRVVSNGEYAPYPVTRPSSRTTSRAILSYARGNSKHYQHMQQPGVTMDA